MLDVFKTPEFWSSILLGTAIFWMTFSSQIRDESKRRLNKYKKDSAFLYKILDHSYDVQVLVVRHNRIVHPDGEDSLDIPPTPDNDTDG